MAKQGFEINFSASHLIPISWDTLSLFMTTQKEMVCWSLVIAQRCPVDWVRGSGLERSDQGFHAPSCESQMPYISLAPQQVIWKSWKLWLKRGCQDFPAPCEEAEDPECACGLTAWVGSSSELHSSWFSFYYHLPETSRRICSQPCLVWSLRAWFLGNNLCVKSTGGKPVDGIFWIFLSIYFQLLSV